MRTRKTCDNFLKCFSSLLIALYPVANPYIFFQLNIGHYRITLLLSDFLVLIFLVVSFCLKNHNRIPASRMLITTYTAFFILSLIGTFFSGFSYLVDSIKPIIIIYIHILFFSYIWQEASEDRFFKYLSFVGTIAVLIAIYQFVFSLQNYEVWDGKLPFFEVYGGWVSDSKETMYGFRANSIFREPSYLGIYLAPSFAYSLIKEKKMMIVIFLTGLFLTFSLVSFGFIAISLCAALLYKKKKAKVLYLVCLMFALCIFAFVYVNRSAVFLFHRITSFLDDLINSSNSTHERLIGNLPLFENYSVSNLIFGVGENQYGSFFNLEKNYSNTFVTCLLNFGLLGETLFLFFLIVLYKKQKFEKKIFYWLFVFLCFAHLAWFNSFFFFAITPLLISESKKRPQELIQSQTKIEYCFNCKSINARSLEMNFYRRNYT